MQIDLATSSDIPSLCALLSHLFTQEAEFIADQDSQQRGLKMIIENPEVGTIIVARKENKVIGMVNLLYTVSTALGKRVVILEDMVVAPQKRGSGVGSRLLEAAVAHADQQGCGRITLLTDADNEGAQRFYRSHGFDDSPMVPLRRVLP